MKNIIGKIAEESKVFGLLLIGLLTFSLSSSAQQDLPFQSGEQLNYTIRYKYGIVMAKAATAQYSVKDEIFRGKPAVKTVLTCRTTGVVDAAFKMRDTLIAYSTTPDLTPIFHRKYLHEGKANYIEDMDYKKFSTSFTSVQSKKYVAGEVRRDTLLTTDGLGFDMLNIFIFARTLDYSNLNIGDSFKFASLVGKDIVPVNLRYTGQAILDKGSIKYKTLRFELDIVDSAFTESKTAMEIWVSDDKNRIPIKLRAKLKIGAAEAEISSTKNLKYPFDSKIDIK